MANSVNPDQTPHLRRLIRVCTVCSATLVRLLGQIWQSLFIHVNSMYANLSSSLSVEFLQISFFRISSPDNSLRQLLSSDKLLLTLKRNAEQALLIVVFPVSKLLTLQPGKTYLIRDNSRWEYHGRKYLIQTQLARNYSKTLITRTSLARSPWPIRTRVF